jgi:hypothetical protein
MALLGKEPVILADADGITDSLELIAEFLKNNREADEQASSLGFESGQKMASAIFGDFCKLVDSRWTEIASFAALHPYWINRTPGEEALSRRRAAFCTLFTIGDGDLNDLAADGAWKSLKARIIALLSLLEHSGLFLLRKGSIESYFIKSASPGSVGKPAAAAAEMDNIDRATVAEAKLIYADVARCIRFASNSTILNEAGALRDLLLSVVAPAHARFRAGDDSQDFNLLAKSILGERSKIFGLAVKNDSFVVSIESKILQVTGFPISIKKDDDVMRLISAALTPVVEFNILWPNISTLCHSTD